MKSISRSVLICCFSIFTSACGTSDAIKYCGAAWLACALPAPKADRECADEPQYFPPPSVTSRTIAIFNREALSWLDPQRYPSLQGFNILEFEQLAHVLSSTQFDAIELKVPPRNNYSRDWQTYSLFLEPTPTPDWVRISLQPSGHRFCEGFDAAARKGWFSLERIRKQGFPLGKCMAVEPIASPESAFAFDIVERNNSTSSEKSYSWRLEDLKAKSTYTEILHSIGSGRNCPSDSVRKTFANVVRP